MKVGAVVIGRNEGARLGVCLASLKGVAPLVYVDSGSDDGSVEVAKSLGAQVVSLDMSTPFTAARARNAGLDVVQAAGVDAVQFVDGDCEVQPDWIATATAHLERNDSVVVVCGRRRERHPEASMYNAHCDREWDTPIGAAKACGGDALFRLDALVAEGGYRADLIAGEEPELCVRLRAAGGQVVRLDEEMTLHDADMHRFSQFWRRARRAGHAYAEGADLHGAPPEAHFVEQTRRAVLWGLCVPVLALVLTTVSAGAALAIAALYPLQILRLWLRDGRNREGFENASLLTLGKLPEGLGVAEFYLRKWSGRRAGIIEYK